MLLLLMLNDSVEMSGSQSVLFQDVFFILHLVCLLLIFFSLHIVGEKQQIFADMNVR